MRQSVSFTKYVKANKHGLYEQSTPYINALDNEVGVEHSRHNDPIPRQRNEQESELAEDGQIEEQQCLQ